MLKEFLKIYEQILKNNYNIELTEEEKEVLNNYKETDFKDINNTLINKVIVKKITSLNVKNKPINLLKYIKTDFDYTVDQINHIDNAIKKCKFLPDGIKAYRGYRYTNNNNNLKSFFEKLEHDKKIKNSGFLSCSLDKDIAKTFSFYTSNLNKKVNNNIIFIITFPKKTKAFPLTFTLDENMRNEVVKYSEFELLLPRDGYFLLKKKTEEELEVPFFRWKNINKKIPIQKFTCYYVDYLPSKKLSEINFDKNNYKVEISPELFHSVTI